MLVRELDERLPATLELAFGGSRVEGKVTRAHDPPLVGAEHDRVPRRGAEGMVAFLHPRAGDGVLIELIDAPPEVVARFAGRTPSALKTPVAVMMVRSADQMRPVTV